MRFAQAYDPDAVGAAREDHDVEPHTDEAKCDLAQFSLVLAVVYRNACGLPLEVQCGREVDLVISQVCGALLLRRIRTRIAPTLVFYCCYKKGRQWWRRVHEVLYPARQLTSCLRDQRGVVCPAAGRERPSIRSSSVGLSASVGTDYLIAASTVWVICPIVWPVRAIKQKDYHAPCTKRPFVVSFLDREGSKISPCINR
jgi:hypothetical protein